MRLLIDDRHMDWDKAWDITSRSVAYTNHTLLPEALGKWDLNLFGSLLPRHLELIYEINRRFLQQLRLRYPGNDAIQRKLSIIDEDGSKAVRMAHPGHHRCPSRERRGGAASDLVKTDLLPEFAELWPGEIHQRDQRRHPPPLDGPGQP